MCDWGVLVYKLDVTKLNSYGSIQVVDNQPLSTGWGCTRDVDIATLHRCHPEISWHNYETWLRSQRSRLGKLCPHQAARVS